MDLEEKKRQQRERARLAYHKLFEGLSPEQAEAVRQKFRARNKASYLRQRALKGTPITEARRLRRNALALARYHQNPQAYLEKMRVWRGRFPEKRKADNLAYRQRNREHLLERARARARQRWSTDREELKRASAAYLQKRRDTEPEFRVLHTLRARMKALLRRGTEKLQKAGRTEDLCGEGFFEHIKRELKPGMELTGIRTRKWHIDHVVPCSWFDMARAEHQRACFHWANLQPEFAEYNLRKKDKCTPADVDRVLARCPEEFRPVFAGMRERAEREAGGRNLSCKPF